MALRATKAYTVAGRHGVESVQRPFNLLLQSQIVFDDQERALLFNCHEAFSICVLDSIWSLNKGSNNVTVVPSFGSLCTLIVPPNSCTY